MNMGTETIVIHYMDESGNEQSYTATSEADKDQKISELTKADLPYKTDILE